MEPTGAVYLDAGYLNAVLKRKGIAQIDHRKLSEAVTRPFGIERLRTYYYDCLPIVHEGNELDRKRLANQLRFHHALKRQPRTEVKLGRLQEIDGQYRQKHVDVLLSIDIITSVYEKQVHNIILIAGDADFVPALKQAKQRGAIVHVWYARGTVHDELLDAADERHEMDAQFLANITLEK